MAELALGQPFKSLDAAASDLLDCRTGTTTKHAANKAAQMLRALSCAYSLERYFSEHGTAAWTSKLSAFIEETLAPPAFTPTVSNPDAPPFPPEQQTDYTDSEARLKKSEGTMQKTMAAVSVSVQNAINTAEDLLPARIQGHPDNMDLSSATDTKINDKGNKLEQGTRCLRYKAMRQRNFEKLAMAGLDARGPALWGPAPQPAALLVDASVGLDAPVMTNARVGPDKPIIEELSELHISWVFAWVMERRFELKNFRNHHVLDAFVEAFGPFSDATRGALLREARSAVEVADARLANPTDEDREDEERYWHREDQREGTTNYLPMEYMGYPT